VQKGDCSGSSVDIAFLSFRKRGDRRILLRLIIMVIIAIKHEVKIPRDGLKGRLVVRILKRLKSLKRRNTTV
jgi:hypothetical protein